MRTFTVIYEIVDEASFAAKNPLDYEHNGVKAFCAARGDLSDKRDALVEALQRIQDEGCFVSRELAKSALAKDTHP